MKHSPKISIIIPCYNEAESIEKVIKSISVQNAEIIVVDNNSTDDTEKIAKKNGTLAILEPKKGYGKALKQGFRNARGNIIATLDGDAQCPSESIPEIIKFLLKNNLDFISASRFPLKNKNSMPFTRKIGNRLLTFACNKLFNLRLKDSQSGMWIFKKEILKNIAPTQNGMAFSEEIKIKAALCPEIKFAEYPISCNPRKGKSKLSITKDGAKNLLFLFKLKFSIQKQRKQKLKNN